MQGRIMNSLTRTNGEQSSRSLVVEATEKERICFTCYTRENKKTSIKKGTSLCDDCKGKKVQSVGKIVKKTERRIGTGNKVVTFNGKTMGMVKWSNHLGISISTLYKRFNQGWSVEKTFTTPVDRTRINKRRKEISNDTRSDGF